MHKLKSLSAAILVALCVAAVQADNQPAGSDMVDIAVELERENETLDSLRERLQLIEENIKDIGEAKRGGMLSDKRTQMVTDRIPATVVSEGLRVERTLVAGGLVYTVTAKNIPTLQVLEAIAKTAGVPLDVHEELKEQKLLERVWLQLRNVEVNETLDTLAGMQALGVKLDKDGLFVGPATTASDQSTEKRLWEQAIAAYQQALVKYPASAEAPKAYLGIAEHYRNTGFELAAAQTAERIIERYSDSETAPRALLFLAQCHESGGRYDEARKTYHRYLDTFHSASDRPLVMLMLAETWIKQDKNSQAIPLLEEIIRGYAGSKEIPMARMRLAECLVAQGQHERAVEQLQTVETQWQSFKKADDLALMIARCLVILERYAPARKRLLRVLRRSASNKLAEEAYYMLGDVFLAEGRMVEALETYRGAEARFPDGRLRSSVPIKLCKAYQNLGLYNKISEVLERSPLEIWAANETRAIIMDLAQYYLDAGRHEKAISLLEDRRWPHDMHTEPDVLLMRAKAYLVENAPARALRLAATVAKSSDNDVLRAEAEHIVGDCHQLLDKPVLAAMAYGGTVE